MSNPGPLSPWVYRSMLSILTLEGVECLWFPTAGAPDFRKGYLARKATACSPSSWLSTFLTDDVSDDSRQVAQSASQLFFFFFLLLFTNNHIMGLYVSSQLDHRSRNADLSQLTPQFPAYQTPRPDHCRSASFTSISSVYRLTSKCRQWLPTKAHLVESSGLVVITFSIQESNGFRRGGIVGVDWTSWTTAVCVSTVGARFTILAVLVRVELNLQNNKQ